MPVDAALLRELCAPHARTHRLRGPRPPRRGQGARQLHRREAAHDRGDRPHLLLRRGGRHDPAEGPGAEPARGLLVREDARARAEPPDLGARPERLGGARAHRAAGRVRDARLPHRRHLDLDLDGLRARRRELLRAPRCRRACASTSACRSRCSRRPPRRRRATTTSPSRARRCSSAASSPRRSTTAPRSSRPTLFRAGQAWAASRGLILADTKYELGVDEAGTLVVADEIHTPDSSRYWYADSYEQVMREGGDPRALDKEYVRRWLVRRARLPRRGRAAAAARRRALRGRRALHRGLRARDRARPSSADAEPPEPRIRRNLGISAERRAPRARGARTRRPACWRAPSATTR